MYKVFKAKGWNKYTIRKRIFFFWWTDVMTVTGRDLASYECASLNTMDGVI